MLDDSLRQRLRELSYERCRECNSLIATDLRRDPATMEEIYRKLPQTYWEGLNPQVGFHRLLERQIGRRGVNGGDLWDIGCGNGNLLAMFGPQWTKAGIEPGREAVVQAKSKGLNVMEGTASSLRLRNVADVAISIDVVEHLPDPETELNAMHEMLRPGGIALLFTGSADAMTARFAGSRWYYLHCIGHVTVFGRSALGTLARRAGFVDITTHRIEHPSAVGLPRWLRRIGGNALRRILGRPPGAMHCFRDHQLVVAAKRQ